MCKEMCSKIYWQAEVLIVLKVFVCPPNIYKGHLSVATVTISSQYAVPIVVPVNNQSMHNLATTAIGLHSQLDLQFLCCIHHANSY